MDKLSFIRTFSPMVIQASQDSGLFPSVMMAQAALESGWGESRLAKLYNNFFGIKADKAWKGEQVILSTQEYISGELVTVQDGFRVYPTPLDSFLDRARFLRRNPRYVNVFLSGSPQQQAQRLQAAGYATDPNYAAKLISTIVANDLMALDIKKKQ